MKRFSAVFVAILLSASAQAECWTVTGLKGFALRPSDSYAMTEDNFTRAKFQVILGETPAIMVNGSQAPYAKGSFISGSEDSVIFYAPGVIEVMSIDRARRMAYMTSSRNGTAMDKAAAYSGSAKEGCTL